MKFKALLVVAFAAFLELSARHAAPLPPAWELFPAPVGYSMAFRYLGSVHLLNKDGFRRSNAPIPPKGPRLRVVAAGDSYTMGLGVAEGAPWSEQLAAISGAEVINYGVRGSTSREISDRVVGLFGGRFATAEIAGERVNLRRAIPGVNPDVIVYAVCFNDVDPATHFLSRTQRWRYSRHGLARLVSTFLAESMEETSSSHGDFARFERDVRRMRESAEQNGARFVVSVFDNIGMPRLIAREKDAIRRAGIEPIPFQLPPGDWVVSAFDWHPSAAAHRLFAEAVAGAL